MLRKDMAEKEIGKVSSYFSNVSVAAIKLSGVLKVGDKIHIKGHTTDFEVDIRFLQILYLSMVKANKTSMDS